MKSIVRSRWFIGLAVLIALASSAAWLRAGNKGPDDSTLVASVKQGDFSVTVTNAGELRAPKFVQITVPQNAQQAEQYQMKIQMIVPEGTIVKEGQLVAELDRSTIASKMSDVTLALQKAAAQREQASLDSTLTLSKAREDMRTAALTLEEKKLAKDQSQFEAPSVKRQAEIDYEKALRALRQDSLDLQTKIKQAIAKMSEVDADLARQQNKLNVVQEVMGQFTIKAPSPGMVIYVKEWNGKKRAQGAQVNSWDPVVATLPDLTKMESVTYINEIDVRKISVGQPVAISLDADPTKKLKGKVTQVANAGEQRPNSDAKVFEVTVEVEQPDTTLRPGMTTGNTIETYAIKNALSVPVEALMAQQGVPFVYRRASGKVTKQEVETGAMNDNEVVITKGLQADDQVLLSAPADRDKIALIRLPDSKVQADTGNAQSLPAVPPAPAPKSDSQRSAPKSAAPAGAPTTAATKTG